MTVVGSCSDEALDLLNELYEPFGGELCRFTAPADAEFAKLAHNVFNATKISFFNELWNVATTIGVDAERAAEVIARSAEASWNPDYGIHGGRPFGGACLPKDVAGFIGFAQQVGCSVPLAGAVRTVNELMAGAAATATEDRVLVSSGRKGDVTALDLRDDNLVRSGPWPE
jgi:UDPglucose 6-dehydrogenase